MGTVLHLYLYNAVLDQPLQYYTPSEIATPSMDGPKQHTTVCRQHHACWSPYILAPPSSPLTTTTATTKQGSPETQQGKGEAALLV